MGLLGDLSNLMVQAYRLWHERHPSQIFTPQQMLTQYVEPSYQL
jgi:hypothetical protein